MKKLLLTFWVMFLLVSCRGGASGSEASAGDTLTSEAGLLTMVDRGTWTDVLVADPWKPGRTLGRYALVPRGAKPSGIPGDAVVVEVPLQKSIVYSDVHASAIAELGKTAAITGVADAEYFTSPELTAAIKAARVADIGSSMAPSVEKTVALAPDAILASPFENAGHGAVSSLGIPVIEMADYMETSPLARAEWIKFLGELYGDRAGAAKLYEDVENEYKRLKSLTDSVASRPEVVTEQVLNGVWYVPGGRSYMATMLRDAGASYPWSDDHSTGSLQLDFTTVLSRANDADYWLIRTFSDDLTLDGLKASYPLNAELKAFKDGNVFNANTSKTTFFNDVAFHPERILADFILVFHPDLLPGQNLKYYKKAE